MTTVQLKPCPFCGITPDDSDINDPLENRYSSARWMVCPGCEATGPFSHQSVEHAMQLWNDRVAPGEFKIGDRTVKTTTEKQRRYWQEDREGRLSQPQ